MSQKLENKTTSELMVIIYIVNCIVMESSEIIIKVASTLATFWSMKKKHKSKRTLSCWFREGIWYDWHRFSAFWLRSKCSICSYQLNIWYEGHVPSRILNLFLQGDGTWSLLRFHHESARHCSAAGIRLTPQIPLRNLLAPRILACIEVRYAWVAFSVLALWGKRHLASCLHGQKLKTIAQELGNIF